jgi:hypothetical protein
MMTHFLYIDPGTGSLFYQAILSGILTVSVFYKSIISFVKVKIFGMTNKDENKAENRK